MTVVVLPGMLCTAEVFAPQLAALRAAASTEGPVEVHLPDADDLDAAADAVLARPGRLLTLVGHSLGAIVAMAAAVRAPERIARLVLVATNAAAPRPDQLAAWAGLAATTRAGRFTEAVAQVTAGMLGPAAPPERTRLALRMAAQVGPDRFLRQLALQATRTDLRPLLPGVAAPATVIGGELDPLCPPAFHRDIAAALPAAALHVLPGAGHLPTLDRPDAVSALLAGAPHPHPAPLPEVSR